MLWLLVVYVSVPFIIKLCPSIQAKLVFLNFGEFCEGEKQEEASELKSHHLLEDSALNENI